MMPVWQRSYDCDIGWPGVDFWRFLGRDNGTQWQIQEGLGVKPASSALDQSEWSSSFKMGRNGFPGLCNLYRAPVAWLERLFLTELLVDFYARRDKNVVLGGYVCVCVRIRTHTHTLHIGYMMWAHSAQLPRVRDKTPGGPSDSQSRSTISWHICVRTCVPSTQVYIYANRQDEIWLLFFLNMFFF